MNKGPYNKSKSGPKAPTSIESRRSDKQSGGVVSASTATAATIKPSEPLRSLTVSGARSAEGGNETAIGAFEVALAGLTAAERKVAEAGLLLLGEAGAIAVQQNDLIVGVRATFDPYDDGSDTWGLSWILSDETSWSSSPNLGDSEESGVTLPEQLIDLLEANNYALGRVLQTECPEDLKAKRDGCLAYRYMRNK
jgi:hypothetical protein